jgi:hypothetical protein
MGGCQLAEGAATFSGWLFFDRDADDTPAMSTDDVLARLKALSERLERLRRLAQEVQNLASDEVTEAHMSSGHRDTPNGTKRQAFRRSSSGASRMAEQVDSCGPGDVLQDELRVKRPDPGFDLVPGVEDREWAGESGRRRSR